MRKVTVYFLLAVFALATSCGSSDRGELTGVRSKKKFFPEKPLGMTLIPGGAFTMGKTDEDIAGALNTPSRTVTVRPFYMDETEITNAEYREFVVWVRDSIVRTQLALLAEEQGFGAASADLDAGPSKSSDDGIQKYKFAEPDTTANVYYKYMMDNYGSLGDLNSPTEGKALNWEPELIWNVADYPDASYAEAMDSLYLPITEVFDGKRIINTKKLLYLYYTFDREGAARNSSNRKDYIKKNVVEVYPDTTVWVKDFNYSYNDPMHQDYFWHQAYNDYPVVGVTWYQAKAFCDFRTQKKNRYLANKKGGGRVPNFRLPTETEWEFAARGGLEYAKYPWGGPYTVTDRGCFMANFKPQRGDYAADGALYTIEAKSYTPNDYGLYNMAGNVSEWTDTAYDPASYYLGSTMNPNVNDSNNKRKVIRGGSWKDVAYFLEVSTRDYEYGDSARSYIGFRTVQDYMGVK
ncbi:gliding motility lipoprotein GldK [Aureibaculum marinum]|uniref:Gliding motility lipoprotein GldK n=1 Tax=Aureibaculum marinum TaxID=2487930 RepID=A0A3N4P3Y4_9FLAO|nr:gliding motility lipoprotein GldK [Aureibaculum marinum]RPD99646.1 gliding motility lipoprotein GldK [Aureibaculum marinum]